MWSKKLLITARSFGKNEPTHLTSLEEAGFSIFECREGADIDKRYMEELLPEIEAWVVSAYPINDQVLEKCPSLRLIIKHGVGVDNIDIASATKRNIIVMNTPGANHIPVADLTITLLLCFTRQIVKAHQNVVSGNWGRFLGTGVYGKYLGIIGLGRVGLAVADRAKGFGMKLLGFDPYAGERIKAERDDIQIVELEQLLESADFISINVPLSEETEGLIGRDALQKMKRSAVIVNTSRGKIVDESAIYQALQENQISGYATDVFEQEPPIDSPLLTLPNVLLTPHIGSYTQDAMNSLGEQVVKSILSVYNGKIPENILNPEVLPSFQT
jgi:D-3-phosphoglycerate dehydrogenase